jgi:hypothetical protein
MNEQGFEESHQAVLVPRMSYDMHNESASYRIQSRPCLVPWDVASWTVVNCVPPATISAAGGFAGKKRLKISTAIPTEASEGAVKLGTKK